MAQITSSLPDFSWVIANFDPVLGIEVHVELSTCTKMFCSCEVSFGADPNTHVCPVCIGLPGALPKVNEEAVRRAIRIGLALNCSISLYSEFARKNYFYPDQPKNYQISQSDKPIAYDGYLDVPLDDGTVWRVNIERAHMEEDTGKSTHIGSTSGRIHGASHSLLDYNRAGVPLIEIVTKPIVGAGARAPEIARAYVTALRDVLSGLQVSDVRMDQGSLRCDANVSLMPKGSEVFGTRTETKNMNSLKSIETAVRYEMCRQADVLLAGGKIIQETRHYNEDDGSTSAGRPKETADDYRYFPDPDLTPLAPSQEFIEQLRHTIPQLPWIIRQNLQTQWEVSDEVMRDLVNLGALDVIVATIAEGASPNAARSWWGSYLAGKANTAGVSLSNLDISPKDIARVIALVDEGKLTVKLAQQVVDLILDGEGSPDDVIVKHGLEVVRDDNAIEKIVSEVLDANPDIVEKIRSGKVQAVGKLVGDVMKATQGKADAAVVKQMIMTRCS